MLRWPGKAAVQSYLEAWVPQAVQAHPETLYIGYFGSYARGDWGVGSDLDIVVIVADSHRPFWQRAADWDTTGFPVPVDLLVYTQEEWETLKKGGFGKTLQKETIWVYRSGSRPTPCSA